MLRRKYCILFYDYYFEKGSLRLILFKMIGFIHKCKNRANKGLSNLNG
jgi:hypothetical protein